MTLGEQIKSYIESKGLKYAFVAEKAGIRTDSFSLLLNGKRGITAEEYKSICMALGVPVNMFIKEDWLNVS